MGLNLESVLIVDGIGMHCVEILTDYGMDVTVKGNVSAEELLQEIPNYDVLVVRSASQVTEEVLQAGKKLKVVARAGAGVDNINVKAAGDRGIGVINAPGANALSACELTCGLIMALARNIVPAACALREGCWDRARYTGIELNGRTLGIIGLGRVGREVAIRMSAFGMRIIGYDPFVSAEKCKEFNCTKLDLDEIWPSADYITLHTPLNDETYKFIDGKVLRSCKNGVRIVNVGRGGLINDHDLYEALNAGQVSGVALDVFEQEPPKDPLIMAILQHPAVLATPHLGASTKEAQARVGQEIAMQLVNLSYPGTFAVPLAEVTNVL